MVESLDKDIEKALNDINVVIIKDEEIEENRNADGALGHGTFGTVRKGLLNKSTEVAIKELIFNSNEQTSDEVVKDILNEIKAFSIGEKLHPAIVKFFGVWKQSSRICFIFELIDGTDLNKICGKMDLKTKLQVIIEICDVLGTLHNAKLIHRDIKPSNVMIDNKTGKVRIIDFGTVKIAKNENTFTVNQKGTDNYMSPELIKIIELEGDDENDVAHFGISPKVDVWAVGCLISEIFTGIIPWQNVVGTNSSAVRKHLIKKTMFPIPDVLKDEKIIKLIKMAVEIDLDKRCTASELKEASENYLKEC